MKICARCGNRVEDSKGFCLKCGSNKFKRDSITSEYENRPINSDAQAKRVPASAPVKNNAVKNNDARKVVRKEQSVSKSTDVEVIKEEVAVTESCNALSVKNWIGVLLLMSLPLVNIIYGTTYLIRRKDDKNKINFVKAYLIIYAVTIIVSAIITVAIRTIIV